jgi:hypothetical protein
VEDAHGWNQELHVVYMDYKKAFNSISHTAIFEALEFYRVGPKFIKLIQQLYSRGSSNLFLNRKAGDPFPIHRGVCQGNTLSPLLFIITINPMLEWISAGPRGHVFVKGLQISLIAYCNDLVLLASSALDIEHAF